MNNIPIDHYDAADEPMMVAGDPPVVNADQASGLKPRTGNPAPTSSPFGNQREWQAAAAALALGTHPRAGKVSHLSALPRFLVARIMTRYCMPCDTLVNLAMAHVWRGKYDHAVKLMLAAIRNDPTFLPGILGLRSLRLFKPYAGTSKTPSASVLMRMAKAVNDTDQEKAVAYFEMHKDGPSRPHALFLHGCYHYFIKDEFREAVDLWEAVTPGDRCAMTMNCLGNCYSDGEGVEKDGKRGIELFSKAVNQGHAAALNNIGYCYLTGCGVVADQKKAIEMFVRASELGSVQAYFNVAWSYDNGKELPRNKKTAALLYTKAAEADHVAAQLNLGLLYKKGGYAATAAGEGRKGDVTMMGAFGEGERERAAKLEQQVPRDYALAEKWLALAAPYDEDARTELEAVRVLRQQQQQEQEQQLVAHAAAAAAAAHHAAAAAVENDGDAVML